MSKLFSKLKCRAVTISRINQEQIYIEMINNADQQKIPINCNVN